MHRKKRIRMLSSLLRRSSGPLREHVYLAGPSGEPVTLTWDDIGIPTVRSTTEDGVFRGLGFCQAWDRFHQMDLFRHLALGRMGEWVGNRRLPAGSGALGAYDLLHLDTMFRAMEIPSGAVRAYRNLDDRHRSLLDSFSSGVNEALSRMDGCYPPEYLVLPIPEPWRPEDCLAISTMYGLTVDFGCLGMELLLDDIIDRIGPDAAQDLYPTAGIEHFESAPEPHRRRNRTNTSIRPDNAHLTPRGSNSWAVDSRWTGTGRPMLANDPHVPLTPTPGFWHPIRLRVESDPAPWRAQGGAFIGFPVVGLGHNERTAWALTNVMRDCFDVVRFRLHPDDPSRYRDGDEWSRFDIRRESIGRRFQRPLGAELRFSPRGTVLPGTRSAEGCALGIRAVSGDAGAMFRGYTEMLRARDWDEHRDALADVHQGAAGWNALYADIDDRIAFKVVGQIPVRRGPVTLAPQAGWKSDSDWIRTLDFEETPEIVEPEDGIIVTANQCLEPEHYEHYITAYYEPPHRAQRIRSLIEMGGPGHISVETFRRIQLDVGGPAFGRSRDSLLRILETAPPADSDAAIRVLEEWDLSFHANSRGAAIWTRFRDEFNQVFVAPLIGTELAASWRESRVSLELMERILTTPADPWSQRIEEKTGKTRDWLVIRAFARTIRSLEQEFEGGADMWRLGGLQQIQLHHGLSMIPGMGKLLDVATIPAPGTDITVNAAFSVAGEDVRVVTAGASMRLIVDLVNPEGMWFSHATGASGDPSSRRYDNLTAPWREGRLTRSTLPD